MVSMTELISLLPIPAWVAYTLAALIQSALLLVVALCSAAVFIWLERKVSARIQDRLGPTRVGGRFGWLQPPADGIKLLLKEDLIPAAADGPLFRLAPYISFCATFCVYLALPFAVGWAALPMNIAVFFILAVAGLEVFGVILGGYASGSKWSLYGAIREAAQVISYEIPLALCVVVVVLLSGSMDLVEIGGQQAGWFWHWNLFHDPFTFVTFFVYCTCALANTNRAPFDLPEAESELVAGFLTEYSGFRWVFFFMAEYAAMFVVSALGATLFLGGWNGPIPVCEWLGLTPEHGGLGTWINDIGNAILGWIGMKSQLDFAVWLGNLVGMCNFIIKGVLGATCMIWIRWTLPRIRIDQVMTTCLKYCVPIASAMMAGVMVWCYMFPDGVVAYVNRPEAAMEKIETPPSAGEAVKPVFKQVAAMSQPEGSARTMLASPSDAVRGSQMDVRAIGEVER
ncbi:MAG: complex I subunit 1 family protein [Thermoguttaceae bacterium]